MKHLSIYMFYIKESIPKTNPNLISKVAYHVIKEERE